MFWFSETITKKHIGGKSGLSRILISIQQDFIPVERIENLFLIICDFN